MDPEIKNWYENDQSFKMKVDTCSSTMPTPQQLIMWMKDEKFMKFLSVVNPSFANLASQMGGMEGGMGGMPTQPTPPKPKEPTPPPKEPTPPPLSPEEQAELEKKEKAESLKKEGNACYKKKEFEKALDFYRQAAEMIPEAPVYLLNQAAVLLMQNNLDDCESMCKKAIEVSREHMCDYVWDAKAYNRLATVEEKRGNIEAAVDYLKSSLREVSDSKIRNRMKLLKRSAAKKAAEALLNPEEALEWKAKGDDAFRSGKWTDAIEMYTESIKRNPEDPKVYNNRSTALCKVMGWTAALEDADKAIAMDMKWVKPHLRKAKIQQALQQYHHALKTLKMAQKIVDEADAPKVAKAYSELQVAIQRANMNPDTERQQRALQDPEIMTILSDPIIDGLLKKAKHGDTSEFSKAMATDERIRDKMEMLMAAGIIQ